MIFFYGLQVNEIIQPTIFPKSTPQKVILEQRVDYQFHLGLFEKGLKHCHTVFYFKKDSFGQFFLVVSETAKGNRCFADLR